MAWELGSAGRRGADWGVHGGVGWAREYGGQGVSYITLQLQSTTKLLHVPVDEADGVIDCLIEATGNSRKPTEAEAASILFDGFVKRVVSTLERLPAAVKVGRKLVGDLRKAVS